jgi:signal-transduction protein with cAMP-binding, CBS, and nucleotidyltransferase domain
MISLDFLENVEAFNDLDDDQLAAIQSCCEIAEFKRGEQIFAAGETPEHFWVVLEGQVNLTWDAMGGGSFAGKHPNDPVGGNAFWLVKSGAIP